MPRAKKTTTPLKKPKSPIKADTAPPLPPPSAIPPNTPDGPLVPPEPGDSSYTLKPDEERFVQAYLRRFQAGPSYLEVRPNVTRASAYELGSRLLKKVEIQREIRAQLRATAKRERLTAPKVLREAVSVLHADLADCFDENNELLPVRDIPITTRRALQVVDVDEYSEQRGVGKKRVIKCRKKRKYKLQNKDTAMRLLFGHLGLIRELDPVTVLMTILPPNLADLFRKALEAKSRTRPVGEVQTATPVEQIEPPEPGAGE